MVPLLNGGNTTIDELNSLRDQSKKVKSLEAAGLENYERSHDGEESGLSYTDTTASSVCNSIDGHSPIDYEHSHINDDGHAHSAGTVDTDLKAINGARLDSESHDDRNNFISFDLPELLRKGAPEQADFLLLAWALFVYCSSEEGDYSEFTWSFSAVQEDEPPTHQNTLSGETGNSLISDVISTIQKIRQDGGEDITGSKGLNIFFGTVNSHPTQAPKWNFSIETWVSDHRLNIRQFSISPHITHAMILVNVNNFVDILEGVLLRQDQTIADAIQIGPRGLAKLWEWNSTVPPTIDRCMHDIIAEHAQEDPDRIAVTSWDGEMTYGILERLSTQLAVRLIGLGVGVGVTVPLCFEKSMWTVVGVLAVMKAGGTFVLTDPHQPEARLQIIAQEVGARIVLTSKLQAKLGSRIAPDATVVAIGSDLMESKEIVPLDDMPLVPSSTILYIIFTSGSTGKPKGVVISHASYTSGAIPRAEAVGYRKHSRVLDFASYAFDVSIDCMLATLSQGGCICVPSDEARVNDLSGAIRSMNVNMAHMTPSVARVLETDAGVMESLKILGLGGELVSAGDARSFGKKTKVIIAYGPSECTVGCTINNDVGIKRNYTTIGKGVGGVTWIVDPTDHNTLTPVGGIGELLIEGPVVGQGYLHNQQNTSLAFIENPKWLSSGTNSISGRNGRLYKTGDLVKYSPDGCGFLVFVGRKDRQVKLRGQRIELAEIEHHLRGLMPSGTSVAVEVITPGSTTSPQTLVAFLAEPKEKHTNKSAPEGATLTSGNIVLSSPELKKVLSKIDKELAVNLPIYMIPTAYIPFNEMPLLVSCKTDRKRLQEIGLAMTQQQLSKFRVDTIEKLEPRTATEAAIHELWTRLFGSDIEIGVHDNFFNLGGDSLKAMKLVADARAHAGISLTVANVFKHPTLAELALTASKVESDDSPNIPEFSLLDTSWDRDAARMEVSKLCGINPESVEDIYPCTPLQEGLMALSAKVSEAYIAQRVVELADNDVARKLQAAFNTVVADCPIMRTRVVQVSTYGLMQVVVNEIIRWNSSNNLAEYLAQDRGITMELGQPLARYGIVMEENTNKAYLILTIHHALYDGWSMPLIVERINRAYRGDTVKAPVPFKAFIRHLCSTDGASSATYWREQLQGATKPQFPPQPRPGYQQQADSLLELHVPISKASASSTTIATAIRGAWAIVAGQYTASDDVVFGETLTGRNAPVVGVEQIEGPMITTVPLRVRVDRNVSVAEYLRDIHEQTVLRMPHEHMGLQHIRRLSPDARVACELKTGLVLHPNTEEQPNEHDERGAPANAFVPAGDKDAAREALKFNSYGLMLVCSLGLDGVSIMASFDSNMVEVGQMNHVLGQLGRTLQKLCDESGGLIGDIDFLTSEDQAQLWRLSNSAPLSISEEDRSVIGNGVASVTATWIVDPSDPEHLLPQHAVGELLVEIADDTISCSLDPPHWIVKGCNGFSGRRAKLHPTKRLCKYNSQGSIVFIGHKSDNLSLPSKIPKKYTAKKVQPTMTLRQKELAKLWSRVLGITINEIGVSDNFFDLGGDSIGAMKLVSEARMANIQLSMAQVFQYKRLNEMGNILEESQSQPAKGLPFKAVPFAALDVDDVEAFTSMSIVPKLARSEWKILDVLPTRPLQEIAVKGTFKLPRYSTRYELFHFDSVVDKVRLFKSCEELVARNEILRTVFVESMGQYYGVVLESIDIPVTEFEIEGDLEAFSQKLCDVDIQTRMRLGSPFVKFTFVQGDDGKSTLIFRLSHAQYDEMCLPQMLHQLSALYEGNSVAESVPFSSFVNHVVRESIPRSFDYWRDLLKGSTMTILRPDIPLQSRKSAALSRSFDISSRSKESTIATLPTAAWAMCLARALSIRDVTFGEVVSGRNIDLSNCDTVIGPCWQYVPFRVKFEEGWTILDLLNFIQNQHIASAPFESVGLKEIVENCTDWPKTVDWFDTVVHQAVDFVEALPFASASSRMETIYPHLEPLREWKFQAFVKGDTITFEIVTFEAWIPKAEELFNELEGIMSQLVGQPDSLVFS